MIQHVRHEAEASFAYELMGKTHRKATREGEHAGSLPPFSDWTSRLLISRPGSDGTKLGVRSSHAPSALAFHQWRMAKNCSRPAPRQRPTLWPPLPLLFLQSPLLPPLAWERVSARRR